MTAATNLAAFCSALADHLYANPDLPTVNISRSLDSFTLQVSSFGTRGEAKEAAALLLWHDTLTDPVLTASPWPRSKNLPRAARVELSGKTVNGTEVRVWDVVPELGKVLGFTKKDANPNAEAVFNVGILRDLTANATGQPR